MMETAVIGASARTRWAEHTSWRGAVRRMEIPGGHKVWVIAGYDEVSTLLADPRLSVDKQHALDGYTGFALPPALDRNLLNMDGDQHLRIRKLAAPAFSRRSADTLRSAVDRIAADVFASLPENDSTAVDLLDRLCAPVPAIVIGDLLGVPADLYPDLRDAATAMFTADTASPESVLRLKKAIGWLTATFAGLIDTKRAAPGDDLISGWIRAGDDDGALTPDELVSLAFLMMMAGMENAVHSCANILTALLISGSGTTATADWQAQRGKLIEQANPMPFAFRRFAVTDLVVRETTIPKGDTVLLSLFGADADPARGNRPSLLFGRGPHYCLGAQAADLIIDAVVPGFFARYPRARLAVAESDLVYRQSWRSHGLLSLPVQLVP